MSHLVPCPGCARHVRQSEASCPFCGVALSLGHVAPPALPRARLGRAALFAFGASVAASVPLVSCGGASEGEPNGGSGSGTGGTEMTTPVYGAPAAGAPNSGGTSFGGSPVYGGPPGGQGGSGGAAAGAGGESAGGGGNAGGADDGEAGAGGIGEPVAVYGAPPSI